MRRFIGQKNTKTNIFRIQADDSVMCGYFCIGFIDIKFAGKSLINFTSLFSPYDFQKNDKIILTYFEGLIFHIIYISIVLGYDLILVNYFLLNFSPQVKYF